MLNPSPVGMVDAAPTPTPYVQRAFAGRYRIRRVIGAGSAGRVYEAIDGRTEQRVALKTLEPRTGPVYPSDELQFRREFHTLANLRHPQVVKVYDFGSEGGLLFYTMELLQGGELMQSKPLLLSQVCQLAVDVCSALAMLHSRRLLHRDISLRNVRWGMDGRAKLIDFGLLATLGETQEPCGTPPYIAPEALLNQPLDQRSDLFSLGALTYRLLTGRHAYPARSISDRRASLRKAPLPPSTLRSEVPRELDELVMDLLSVSRAARPRSAAEVIERLRAVDSSLCATDGVTVQGYLRSTRTVGRDDEIAELRQRVGDATVGRGSVVLFSGRSGMGKSRLLQEASLEAKIGGAVVARVRADSPNSSPFEAIRHLVAEVKSAMPSECARMGIEHSALLASVIPELPSARPSTSVPNDPRERRMAILGELGEWFRRLCAYRPLVLIIDDLHRCDEASAAALVSLAQFAETQSILIVGAVRSDEHERAPASLGALRRLATNMPLSGLGLREVQSLVRSAIGDTASAPRVARFLMDRTGGHPLMVSELLEHLVSGSHVRYEAGAWTVPGDLSQVQVPTSLHSVMDARVEQLDPQARQLAEVMAVLGSSATVERCVAITSDLEPEAVFDSLARLLSAEVLVLQGETYSFRHDGIREAVLRGLDHDERRVHHLRIGRLLGQDPSPDRLGEIGWHLLQGGEERRGAELLERAGSRLFETTSFVDSIRPLEAAVQVYERQRIHHERLPQIYYMLSMAGFFSDPTAGVRFNARAVSLLRKQSGMALVPRLQKVLGMRLGLTLGVLVAALRHRLTPKRSRGLAPLDAIRLFMRCIVFGSSLALARSDLRRLHRLRGLLAPLSCVKKQVVVQVCRFVDMIVALSDGNFGSVRELAEVTLSEYNEGVESTAFERRLFYGGVRMIYGLSMSEDAGEVREKNLDALAASDLALWRLSAQQLEQTYCLRRGAWKKADAIMRGLETTYAQLGSIWQLELSAIPVHAKARGLIDDALGLRQSLEEIERGIASGVFKNPSYYLTHAELCRIRGEHDQAIGYVEQALAFLGRWSDRGFGRTWAYACLPEILLDAGRIEEADRAAQEAWAYVSDAQVRDDGYYFRAGRVRAKIHLAKGEVRAATELLDALIEEAKPTRNPVYQGLLHEVRADAAKAAGDEIGYRRHRVHVSLFFDATENPTLIARARRAGRVPLPTLRAKRPSSARDARDSMVVPASSNLSQMPWVDHSADRAEPDESGKYASLDDLPTAKVAR